ncbi:hypothetical protein BJY22_007364 [Kribbella shirazensis]|uniref:Uncharacterized protein n=1 Tax=Kribbella shirazensis TaxID=1105143 RepID=A0A7X5VI60_9ACTN|nr:hypothetical protein [Kribbella shirazensis]
MNQHSYSLVGAMPRYIYDGHGGFTNVAEVQLLDAP